MPESDLPSRLHSLAIHLLRHVRTEDAAAGMSAARLSALSVLVFGGARSMGEMAAAEQVTAPTMTRLVAGLEREGLVRRRGDPADARVVVVEATARGRAALEAGRARRVAKLERLLAGLDAGTRRTVAEAVAALEGELLGEGGG